MTPKLTTRLPNGITNAGASQTMESAGFPDPTWAMVDCDDYLAFDAALYTVTLVGTGTFLGAAAAGGTAILTTTAAAVDAVYVQRTAACFQLIPGKDTFFKFAATIPDRLLTTLYMGLIATTATPLAPSDGLYLVKAAASATLSLVHVVGGVSTSYPLPASLTLTNAVAFELGIHVTPSGTVEVYFNPTTGANVINGASGATRGPVLTLTGVTLTQALLSPSYGILNSTAVANTAVVDYIVAASHR